MADKQGRPPYGEPGRQPGKPDVVVENRQSPLVWIVLLAVAVLVVLWLTGVFDRNETAPADTVNPPALEDVQDAVDEAGADIGQGIDDVGNALNQELDDAADAVNQGLNNAGDAVNQGLNDAGDALNQGLNNAGDAIDQGLEDAGEGAEELFGN